MHLLTRSARLSRSSWGLRFSVRIQHSRAARDRVIGSASCTGSGGVAVWFLITTTSGFAAADSALGASAAAVGPFPSVSQAASASALETSKTKRVTAMNVPAREFGEFIRRIPNFESDELHGGPAICPK